MEDFYWHLISCPPDKLLWSPPKPLVSVFDLPSIENNVFFSYRDPFTFKEYKITKIWLPSEFRRCKSREFWGYIRCFVDTTKLLSPLAHISLMLISFHFLLKVFLLQGLYLFGLSLSWFKTQISDESSDRVGTWYVLTSTVVRQVYFLDLTLNFR